MKLRGLSADIGACQTTATAFGILAGLGGITHGVGEVMQGNVRVQGIALNSWTTGPISEHLGGEPGLTVLPTALLAGVATLTLAAAVVSWSIAGVRRDHGGSILILLSSSMLLAGGGVGPPVIGILAGAVGRYGADRQPRRLQRPPGRARRALARAWPALFTLSFANALFLVVGSVVLVYAADLHMPTVFEGGFYLSVLLLLLHLVAAPTYDSRRSTLARDALAPRPTSLTASLRRKGSRAARPALAGSRIEE
jgi:hypothetical protein